MKISKVLQSHREDIRLHLGCGPNRLPGWINCEFANTINEEWQVEFDITTFPYDIENNTVSRIYWSHVIEHIDPSQVPQIFQEFLRILKPGGVVDTEYPDILKLSEYIVEDPTRIYTQNKKIRKRAIAGMFGDVGKYKDPIMLHKWGYSEDAIIELCYNTGFRRAVRKQPWRPKTKKPTTDGRVIAIK